jgi:hypothetical protein
MPLLLWRTCSRVTNTPNMHFIAMHQGPHRSKEVGPGSTCGCDLLAPHHLALHCTALHCTALHCTALHCTALHCTALHCTAAHPVAIQHCDVLPVQYPLFHCTVLSCTAGCCRSLWGSPCATRSCSQGCSHPGEACCCMGHPEQVRSHGLCLHTPGGSFVLLMYIGTSVHLLMHSGRTRR